jgi:hypothetical protein
MMPEVSGLDVLRRLDASPLEIARLITPNVFAALRKPFDDIDHLITAVRECIEGRCNMAIPALAPQPVPRAA